MFDGDLASFLDFIRQHGDAVYAFLTVYSMANSLLLALFAGYAAQAGALGYEQALAACWAGTFASDVVRASGSAAASARVGCAPFPGCSGPSRRRRGWLTATMSG